MPSFTRLKSSPGSSSPPAHEGVGHARHRRMGIALAPPVAGGGYAHQARIEPVLHIALEDAVLDQDGFAGRRALVVDRERAAPLEDRAIVHHRHALRRDRWPMRPEKGGRALAVEIALKPVPDRLMQQHAGPAGAEQHGHLARRRVDRAEVGLCLFERFVDGAVPGGFLEQPS
jgi:hypothetical protein